MDSQKPLQRIVYSGFYSVHENTKGGKPGKLHRPKRNYTFNRIAVPSDYIMNGGKIKEVKNMRTQYKQFRITSTFLNDKLWSADDKMQNYNNHLVTIVNT